MILFILTKEDKFGDSSAISTIFCGCGNTALSSSELQAEKAISTISKKVIFFIFLLGLLMYNYKTFLMYFP